MSKNLIEDGKLVVRAKDGDQAAFTRLMAKYHKSVYYMLLKMVYNTDDAEDLTQEAFSKAFASLHKYDTTYAFSTWLFRIATNNCIDFIRKKRLNMVSLDNTFNNADGDELTMDVKDDSLTPEEKMKLTQKKEFVKFEVTKLPIKYRTLIELRYFKEYSYNEIAESLDLPLGTVKAQLNRAKSLLQNLMAKKINRI